MAIKLSQAQYDQAVSILANQRDAELAAVSNENQQITAAQQRRDAAQGRADAINTVLAGLEVG